MPAAQPVYPGQTTLSAAPEPRGYGSILPPHLHCPPPLGLCPRCAPGLPGPIPAFSLQRGPHFLLRGASCDPRLRVRALLHSPSALHACQVAQLCATLWPTALRLLCPWDSPGKNTGVGCHFLLQGVFPTQGSNPPLLRLPHWRAGSLPLASPGKLPGTPIRERTALG